MTFAVLRQRLLAATRARIRNGEITERGLARRTGISQPHMHNILKGIRTLTPESGDALLVELHLTLLDLVRAEEWERRGK